MLYFAGSMLIWFRDGKLELDTQSSRDSVKAADRLVLFSLAILARFEPLICQFYSHSSHIVQQIVERGLICDCLLHYSPRQR